VEVRAPVDETILIVEDENAVRQTVREVLEDEGYVVAEASNGQEALDYLRANPRPCVVLLDLMMPVMSGVAFLEAVKKDSSLKEVTIVIVSAAAKEKIEEARRASTAVGVLTKPIQLSVLLNTIARYC